MGPPREGDCRTPRPGGLPGVLEDREAALAHPSFHEIKKAEVLRPEKSERLTLNAPRSTSEGWTSLPILRLRLSASSGASDGYIYTPQCQESIPCGLERRERSPCLLGVVGKSTGFLRGQLRSIPLGYILMVGR